MKTLFYFLTTALVICSFAARAELFTVDNNQPASIPEENLYITLQEAVNVANVDGGDTIQVIGSATAYSALTLTIPLVIVGNGFFLGENPTANVNKQPSSIYSIRFDPGSEGSKIMGITFKENANNSYPTIVANNIEISGCYLLRSIYIGNGNGPIRNLNINRCYFVNSGISYNFNNVVPPIDFYFANNIVNGGFQIPNGTSGSIINNVFAGERFILGTSSSLEIQNNILLSTEEEEITIPVLEANISNNIAALQTFGTANDNQINVQPSQIFVAEGTTDGQWQVRRDGRAAEAGRDGVDIGAFGGPNPYRLSGVPTIPRITDLSTDGYVNEEGQLLINIQVTAN